MRHLQRPSPRLTAALLPAALSPDNGARHAGGKSPRKITDQVRGEVRGRVRDGASLESVGTRSPTPPPPLWKDLYLMVVLCALSVGKKFPP